MITNIFLDLLPENKELSVKEYNSAFVANLVNWANTHEPLDFEFICNWNDFILVTRLIPQVRKIVRGFEQSSKDCLNKHIENLNKNIDDVNLVFGCRIYREAANYYEIEVSRLNDMLDEFYTYMFSGHVMDMWCNRNRDYKDLKDFRKGE